MAILTTRCPHCGADPTPLNVVGYSRSDTEYSVSVHCSCPVCTKPSCFVLAWRPNVPGHLGWFFTSEATKNVDIRAVTQWSIKAAFPRGGTAVSCPDYVPENVATIFKEAAECLALGFFDSSGTMYRKVLDACTKPLLPPQPQPEEKAHPDFIAWKVRKDLKLRLDWLFDKGRLPSTLKEIAECVREDGNDAAHAVEGIDKDEALDLQDFTVVFLETLYTLPGQIEENKRRRAARRGQA